MSLTAYENSIPNTSKLPPWFKQNLPDMNGINEMKKLFRSGNLHTVCESALCPNMGQCWRQKVATFMILGDVCTRACRFCAITAGRPHEVDHSEPNQVAQSVKTLGLRYVVVTSVARDDLEDEGATQFAKTIAAIKELTPHVKVEVLIPDFSANQENLKIVTDTKPEVICHNIETVRRLSPKIRPQADYDRSLDVLRMIKPLNDDIIVKSSLMVGLGETQAEVIEVIKDLFAAGCAILTIGQYLAPTKLKRHLPIERFVTPEEFEQYIVIGKDIGFTYVKSGPLVRSSYIAEEGYQAIVG